MHSATTVLQWEGPMTLNALSFMKPEFESLN